MHTIKAVCAVLAFALIATILLPLVVFDFNAAQEDFPVITVYDFGAMRRHETAAQTVEEFLHDLGMEISELDRVSYPMDSPLYDGMEIRVLRAVPIIVLTDSNLPRSKTVRYGTTVEQIVSIMQEEYDKALLYANELGRAVGQWDRLRFQSWRTRYFTEVEAIPYETIRNYTNAVRAGRTHVRQTGAAGEHEVTVNVVYIGGYEDSRTISDAIMLSEPVAAIYDIGTAPLGALTDPTAEDFHYVRRIRMQATAYCACFRCTGRNPGERLFGVTASGRHVQHGIVAVDRSVIPLGTHLYVGGYGFALAADVGSAIVGNKIDLFMYCHYDALRFGRRYVDVWVLS